MPYAIDRTDPFGLFSVLKDSMDKSSERKAESRRYQSALKLKAAEASAGGVQDATKHIADMFNTLSENKKQEVRDAAIQANNMAVQAEISRRQEERDKRELAMQREKQMNDAYIKAGMVPYIDTDALEAIDKKIDAIKGASNLTMFEKMDNISRLNAQKEEAVSTIKFKKREYPPGMEPGTIHYEDVSDGLGGTMTVPTTIDEKGNVSILKGWRPKQEPKPEKQAASKEPPSVTEKEQKATTSLIDDVMRGVDRQYKEMSESIDEKQSVWQSGLDAALANAARDRIPFWPDKALSPEKAREVTDEYIRVDGPKPQLPSKEELAEQGLKMVQGLVSQTFQSGSPKQQPATNQVGPPKEFKAQDPDTGEIVTYINIDGQNYRVD